MAECILSDMLAEQDRIRAIVTPVCISRIKLLYYILRLLDARKETTISNYTCHIVNNNGEIEKIGYRGKLILLISKDFHGSRDGCNSRLTVAAYPSLPPNKR